MKKIYKYVVTSVVLLSVVLACSKKISDDSILSFDVEFSARNFESFLNSPTSLDFVIIEGESSVPGDYSFKYSILEGAGSYMIESRTINEGVFISLSSLTNNLTYIGTETGTNRVLVTIKDRLDIEKEFELTYIVNDTDFSFDVIPSSEVTYVGGIIDLSIQLTEQNDVDYEMQYMFVESDADVVGNGNITIGDQTLEENTLQLIEVGDNIWQFEGTEVGVVNINFLIISSLGIEMQETIRVEITETPNFTFETSVVSSELITNTTAEITFGLTESVGTSEYTMNYATSNVGDFTYNGVAYQPGDEIPIEVGVTTGTYTGTVAGLHELGFTVTNANNVPIEIITTIPLMYADFVPDAPPIIQILGANPLTIEAVRSFTDQNGAEATDDIDNDLTADITSVSTVVSNRPGNYTITYSVEDSGGNTAEATRDVIVEDTTPPTITLAVGAQITHRIRTPFTTPVATVTDIVDTGLTANVSGTVNVNVLGNYDLEYVAVDAAGNRATRALRVRVVDDVIPVISLNGGTITLNEGDTYIEAATATDNVDGNITNRIDFGGSFNGKTDEIGTFQRTYNVMDAAGNRAAQRTRTIVVKSLASFSPQTGVLTGRAGKTVTVTLTSTDGPGSGNARVDVLNTNGVRINLQQTCWGSETCGNGLQVSFQFTMPSVGRVNVSGFHNPTGTSGLDSSSRISIQVGTELTTVGVVNANLRIPR